jgi:hypothetical protein
MEIFGGKKEEKQRKIDLLAILGYNKSFSSIIIVKRALFSLS